MIDIEELQNYRIVGFDGEKFNFLRSDSTVINKKPFLIDSYKASDENDKLSLTFEEIPLHEMKTKRTTVIYSCAFANSTLVSNLLSYNKNINNVEVLSEPLERFYFASIKGRQEYLEHLENFSKIESLSNENIHHIIIKSQPKFWVDSKYNNCNKKIFLKKNIEDLAISFVRRSSSIHFFREYIAGLTVILKNKRSKFEKLYKVLGVKELSGLILYQYEKMMQDVATDIIDVNNISKNYSDIITKIIGPKALCNIDGSINKILNSYSKDTSITVEQLNKAKIYYNKKYKEVSKPVLDHYYAFKENRHRLSSDFEEYFNLI